MKELNFNCLLAYSPLNSPELRIITADSRFLLQFGDLGLYLLHPFARIGVGREKFRQFAR